MPALTPTYLMDLESNMKVITQDEYARFTQNLWWTLIAKTRPSGARREIINWLLSTAMIEDQEKGGQIEFEDIVSATTEFEHKFSGAGLKLRRPQLEDTDGNGVDLAAHWSRDVGAYMGYWPQKRVVHMLMNGHDIAQYKGYDKKAFFATDHPVNPFRPTVAPYKNLFTGADALPIDVSVTVDVALANMSKLFSRIARIKMPNGIDPRFLRPRALLCAPELFPRAVQLTQAKFIAQAAGSAAGSGDVEALIKALGYATPVMVDELANFENETTYYVVAEQVASSELGAMIYSQREAFRINYYGNLDQAELDRKDELEWHCKGRNVGTPGHPYLLFKVKAS